MDSVSMKELKSWTSTKLCELKKEMKIEIQSKMADLSKELATCFRLQREQVYTLLQMQTHTREKAIEKLLSEHTSETCKEQLANTDRTGTAEDRKTEEKKEKKKTSLQSERKTRQSARRKINQEMDSISKLSTEKDEIKREKEREIAEQKKEKEERNKRKSILKQKITEEIIKHQEEETRKKDKSQRELERKRKEEEDERRQNNSRENTDVEIKSETDSWESETDSWESETDPEVKEDSQVPSSCRRTPLPPPARIKLQEENMTMPEREKEKEEKKKEKTHTSGLARMMKLMQVTSNRVLSLQCAEKTSKEEKRQRNLEKKRKQEKEKREREEKRKEETQKTKLEKKKMEEERQRDLEKIRKLEEWKKELEKRKEEESSENGAVEMNSESDGWESETDSEEEECKGGPAAQSRTPSRHCVTFKLPEETMYESEKGSEEDTPHMSRLTHIMKLMRTTSQRVLSLQSGRSNFEVSRGRYAYRPMESAAETSLYHSHASSSHPRGALAPGAAPVHPHSAGKRHDAGWTIILDQAKRAKHRSHPPLTHVSSDRNTSRRSKHTRVHASLPKFPNRECWRNSVEPMNPN